MDDGNGFDDIKGEDGNLNTDITFTKAALIAGQWYDFKLRAKNVHGWSEFSSIISAEAAQWPDPPAAITTSLTNLKIRISWVAPTDNFKDITAYQILIQDTNEDGTFIETSFCDGSNLVIRTQLFCDVPVQSVLRQEPYSLELG